MKKILHWIINLFSYLPESGIKTEIRSLFYQDIVSERVVEYPLVFRHLKKHSGKILDVGCRYSNLVLQLASLGYQTYGLDLEPYEYFHPNLKIVTGDIRKTKFKSNYFDYVTAISTVEHIGLNFYEKSTNFDQSGDKLAIDEIYRILRPSGELIFTAPFGISALTTSYRVYDFDHLNKLFSKFRHKKYLYYGRTGTYWQPIPLSIAKKIRSDEKVSVAVLAICSK